MSDKTIDVTPSLGSDRILLKMVDNSDDTYSIAASVVSGAATLEVNLDNANDDVLVYGNDGTTNRALKTDSTGRLQMDDGVVFDTILITYTDATKLIIQKVEWKLAGVVAKTFTPTFGVSTDTWVKT